MPFRGGLDRADGDPARLSLRLPYWFESAMWVPFGGAGLARVEGVQAAGVTLFLSSGDLGVITC